MRTLFALLWLCTIAGCGHDVDMGSDGGPDLATADLSHPPDLSGDLTPAPPDLELPPSCRNAMRDNDETDVDCGGATCERCGDGLKCVTGSDCLSTICGGGSCQPL